MPAPGSPAVSGTVTPAGGEDSAEISDDGDAGMAHFGRINKASRTSMIFCNGHAHPGYRQQERVSINQPKPDTLTTLPGLDTPPLPEFPRRRSAFSKRNGADTIQEIRASIPNHTDWARLLPFPAPSPHPIVVRSAKDRIVLS